MALSIVVSDESGEFADLTKTVRGAHGAIQIRADETSIRRAMRVVLRTEPDVFLVGLRLPDCGTLSMIRTASAKSRTRVVAMCQRTMPSDAIVALEAGAAAYLFTGTEPDDVLRILRTVAAA